MFPIVPRLTSYQQACLVLHASAVDMPPIDRLSAVAGESNGSMGWVRREACADLASDGRRVAGTDSVLIAAAPTGYTTARAVLFKLSEHRR